MRKLPKAGGKKTAQNVRGESTLRSLGTGIMSAPVLLYFLIFHILEALGPGVSLTEKGLPLPGLAN